MELFLEYVDKVGLIGIIVAITAFLVGMKFPDWDFKLKLQHRNILTHSPLFLFLLLELYKREKNDTFRFFIAGFALALVVHFIFDFFPKGWSRGALLHIPVAGVALSPRISKIIFAMSIMGSTYIAISMTKKIEEFIFLGILALWTFLKNTVKEEKFFRPCILFFIIFIFVGSFKFDEINKNINKTKKYVVNYVREFQK